MRTIAVLLIPFLIVSCSTRSSTETTTVEDTSASENEWSIMDEFHMLMAESYHPYLDSGNLEPAKQMAPEMVALAEKWATSSLPKKVDNEKVQVMLNDLKEQVTDFAGVASGDDEDAIATALTQVHDHFHKIEEAWYKGVD